MQCRVTLTTDVQQPWPAMLVKHIQEGIKSKAKTAQETVVLMFLEPWQVKQMQSDTWISEECMRLRSQHGITCLDIKVEVVKDAD